MAGKIHDEQLKLDIIINGNNSQKVLGDLQEQERKLVKTQKDLLREKTKLIAAGKKESDAFNNLSKEIQENKNVLDQNKTEQGKLRQQIGLTALKTKDLRREQKRLKLEMSNFADNTPQWKELNRELQKVENRLGQVRDKMKGTNGVLSRMKKSFSSFGGILAAVGIYEFLGKLGVLTQANAELAESQTDVRKTTGLTNKEVKLLTKNLKNLDTRTPIEGLLGIAEEAGRLGKKGVKDIQAFVTTADMIAVSLGDDLNGDISDNIRLIGKLADNYGVADKENVGYAKSLEKVGSAINEVSANGSAQAGFLVDYLKRLVGVSKQTNITAQDQIGYAAVLDESGQSVEVSGTTMSKVMFDMFSDTSTYAKVAGIDIKKFTKIMNTDANEAFLLFLEGLNGNNGGLQVMSKKLADLGIKGARGIGVLTSLAAETDKVREKQELANKALKENTSLTAEFQEKNSNLPALLEKISNHFSNLFTQGWIADSIKGVVNWFGKLVGAIKDANEEFDLQSQATFENVKNNRLLANESQNLLDRYQDLTKDGLTPTADKKKELDTITLQLKDRLGESVIAIDKETGSYILNTEAVKEQIKMKRLTADEEAMTLVSRKKGTEERIKELKLKARDAKKEFELRRDYFEETNKQALASIRTAKFVSSTEKQQMIERLDGYDLQTTARKTAIIANGKLNTQIEREIDLTKKLNELNFTQADVDNYFKEYTPEEGTERMVGNTRFVFKNGKWVAQRDPVKTVIDPTDEEKKKADAIKKQKIELSEWIAAWNEEQDLQEELRKFDKESRDEEEEILRLEALYEKMAEDAGFETLLAAGLEDIKNLEVQKIRDKWSDIRQKKLAAEHKKVQIKEQKFKEQLLKAELKVEEARRKIQLQGLNSLQSIMSKKSILYKALLGIEKAAAISDIITNSSKAIAQVRANLAIANFKAIAANPILGGQPFVGRNTLLATKEILSTKLSAGAQIVNIAGTALEGFEKGLYPVTRTDGKKFKAEMGGPTSTQIVSSPTVMQDYLVGERRRPEMIIDDITFSKLDPRVINHILNVHQGKTTGYENGKYEASSTSQVSGNDTTFPISNETNNNQLVSTLEKLTSVLDNGIAVLLPYDKIEDIADAIDEIKDSKNNGIIS